LGGLPRGRDGAVASSLEDGLARGEDETTLRLVLAMAGEAFGGEDLERVGSRGCGLGGEGEKEKAKDQPSPPDVVGYAGG